MRDLRAVLQADYGLDLSGWRFSMAIGITPDGRTIVGRGNDPEGNGRGWIAHLGCEATSGVLDCNSNGSLDVCDLDANVSLDCQGNRLPDECDIAGGTSGDCNVNATPDECEIAAGLAQDCNTNGVPDLCDIASTASADCNLNDTPDECELVGAPFVSLVAATSRKVHDLVGAQDLPINIHGDVESGTVTSEPRVVGITQLRLAFDATPGAPGTLEERTCSANAWQPYTGESQAVASVNGNALVLSFAPPLENARTYRITIEREVSSIFCQSIQVRNLKGDASSDGRVDAVDRSLVVGMWTGAGYSPRTDIDLSGRTDASDRSAVVGVWTGSANCAP